MPTMKLSHSEAKALKAKRARDAAHNASVGRCVNAVRARLKGCKDPLEAGTLNAVLGDLRQLLR